MLVDFPHAVQLGLTSRCNLACKECLQPVRASGPKPVRDDLDASLLSEIVEFAGRAGEIIVSGLGEALLHPHCLALLERLDRRGVRISMSTNGTTITPEVADRLASLERLTHINVSLDSADPLIYRRLRGGNLEVALAGLRNLVSSVSDRRRLSVSAILSPASLEGLSGLPRLLATYGVPTLVLQAVVDYRKTIDHRDFLALPESVRTLAALRSSCIEAGVELRPTIPERLVLEETHPEEARARYFGRGDVLNGLTRQCTLPWEMPFIDSDGRVFFCCGPSLWADEAAGNLHDSSLETIWRGTAFENLRKALLSGDGLSPACRTCNLVPLGEHPFRRLAAENVITLEGTERGGEALIVFRNRGTTAWTREHPVRVGTAVPRDRASEFCHPSWVVPNRAAEVAENVVGSGETGAFRFRLESAEAGVRETFQLVAEGDAWISGTRFQIGSGPARSSPQGKEAIALGPTDAMEPGLPDLLTVEVTSQCNLHCPTCAWEQGTVRSGRTKGSMGKAVWKRVVEIAPAIGHVNLNGWGENFLRRDFLDLVEELDHLGVATSFSTNGTLLSLKQVTRLARLEHFMALNVSVDSADPEAYRTQRIGPLDPVIAGLHELSTRFPDLDRVTISALVTPATVGSLDLLPGFLEQFGLHTLILQSEVAPVPPGWDGGGGAAEIEIVRALLPRLLDGCQSRGISLGLSRPLQHRLAARRPAIWDGLPEKALAGQGLLPSTRQCNAPWEHTHIDKDGMVYPCCVAPRFELARDGDEAVVGNLGERSFAEIWRGEKFRSFRRRLLTGDLPAICRRCCLTSEGPHFFAAHRAALLRDVCEFSGDHVTLFALNVGVADWTSATELRVGTTRPRGTDSPLAAEGWLSPNRPASLREELVRPGQTGSFAFRLGTPVTAPASFQLIVENLCWLPGTEVTLMRDGTLRLD